MRGVTVYSMSIASCLSLCLSVYIGHFSPGSLGGKTPSFDILIGFNQAIIIIIIIIIIITLINFKVIIILVQK